MVSTTTPMSHVAEAQTETLPGVLNVIITCINLYSGCKLLGEYVT